MKQTEALKLALEALDGFNPEFICQATHHKRKDQHSNFDPCPNVAKYDEAIIAIKEALAQPEQQDNGKLKVTLQDTPTEIELAQYKRMFEAACSALGAIGDALGVDPEEGGAEPILGAIADLKLTSPPQRKPLEGVIDVKPIGHHSLQLIFESQSAIANFKAAHNIF